VRACEANRPKLEAEESLLAVRRTALALGTMERGDRERLVAEWLDAIDPDRPRVMRAGGVKVAPPFSEFGIGLHVVGGDADGRR